MDNRAVDSILPFTCHRQQKPVSLLSLPTTAFFRSPATDSKSRFPCFHCPPQHSSVHLPSSLARAVLLPSVACAESCLRLLPAMAGENCSFRGYRQVQHPPFHAPAARGIHATHRHRRVPLSGVSISACLWSFYRSFMGLSMVLFRSFYRSVEGPSKGPFQGPSKGPFQGPSRGPTEGHCRDL